MKWRETLTITHSGQNAGLAKWEQCTQVQNSNTVLSIFCTHSCRALQEQHAKWRKTRVNEQGSMPRLCAQACLIIYMFGWNVWMPYIVQMWAWALLITTLKSHGTCAHSTNHWCLFSASHGTLGWCCADLMHSSVRQRCLISKTSFHDNKQNTYWQRNISGGSHCHVVLLPEATEASKVQQVDLGKMQSVPMLWKAGTPGSAYSMDRKWPTLPAQLHPLQTLALSPDRCPASRQAAGSPPPFCYLLLAKAWPAHQIWACRPDLTKPLVSLG